MKPDYPSAYATVMGNEIGSHSATRGYVNDPYDPGGETIAGIARKYHPQWSGWAIVDTQKQLDDFPNNLSTVSVLDDLIRDFYRTEFWDKARCSDMPDHALALELFDTGVNMSPATAGRYLQQALNLLNVNGTAYPDIAEDGAIGPGTLATLAAYIAYTRGNIARLLTVMNVLQGWHYIEQMRANKVKEKYVGWFDRVMLSK